MSLIVFWSLGLRSTWSRSRSGGFFDGPMMALRSRAERNDWYRLLASDHGEPLLSEFAREFRSETDTDMLELLADGGLLYVHG